MSASFRLFLLFAVFTGIAEMCGNVNQAAAPAPAVNMTNNTNRRRRSADGANIIHIEFQTTLTSAGDLEFSKIENEVFEEFEELLAKAHRQVTTGTEGGSVLKYMFIDVDCGTAQLFAQSVKDLISFVTGGTIKCGNQASSI
uniref:SEA domain-containing protein n=2 Tax=Caenorhabditis tropicalis TaxID=1561998 RepID=A0A1I7U3G8_9PELO